MSLQHIREPDPQKTSWGEEHGLLKVTANSVPFGDYKRFKEKDREKMKSLHTEQCRMVKVTYIHKRNKNERRELTYCQWEGDPLLQYKFVPDHSYEIPKGLVDMINKQKKVKREGRILNPGGQPIIKDEYESGDDMFVSAVI